MVWYQHKGGLSVLRCDISVLRCNDCVKVRCLFKGKVYVCSKVWLCTSGADRYLKSHSGLYRQLLSRSRSEHLVELINTGKMSEKKTLVQGLL